MGLTDRLDWNLLRTFIVILQEHSISRAAARLHLTQPAVSQALRRLETQLGQTLIQRQGHTFRATSAGEEVYRIASEVFGQIAQLDGDFDRREEISGTIRLLMISRVESPVFDEFLADFHRLHPQVNLQVEVMRSADILFSLQQRTATAGFSLCRTPVDRLEQRVFLRQRYGLFCGRHHRLFGRSGLAASDLLAENFVSFTSDQLGDALSPLTVFRETEGFTGQIVAASPSLDEVRRLIFAGYGIGCLPEHAVSDDLARARLWRLPPDEGVADVDVFLMWHRERRQSAADTAFFRHYDRFVEAVPLAARLGLPPVHRARA